jgi:hypothetical protein
MFTGHEPPGYVDDVKNMRVPAVGFMLSRDSSLLEPLKEGVGAVFERDDKGAPWRRVTDWSPDE